METINRFDKNNINDFTKELYDAIRPVLEKYGVTVRQGKTVYSTYSCEEKMNFEIDSDEANRVRSACFDMNAEDIGIPNGCYRKVIAVNGHQFRLLEINTKSKQYPVRAMRLDNEKEYDLTVQTVLDALV